MGIDTGLRVTGLPQIAERDETLIDSLVAGLNAGGRSYSDSPDAGPDSDPARELPAALFSILSVHLSTPIALRPLSETPYPFHRPPPSETILRLIPTADTVLIEYEPALPPRTLALALAHAAGHILLGHVRPGDPVGHWDTADTVLGSTPARRWDREVRERLPMWSAPTATKRASLEECTPIEKSWLVLLQHIGQMVGEASTIHDKAAEYQPAAYQRQAAQRLVAQLEEHGGAMLCDGVGLGKTYVATTVMVHYANFHMDEMAKRGRSVGEDPFRVTILAPHSVVSTWQREALPALGNFGVPSATIRAMSHASLSRILSSSAILNRNDGELSDFEHMMLSDLVIVDEAHNFRSIGARRTAALRDILRLQPRKDQRRRVLLLTATPVNNSLEDLRQEVSLLFSKPLWFNPNTTPDGYRARVLKDIEDRIKRARKQAGDVSAALILDEPEGKFSTNIEFREDLKLGVQVARVGDYLKEQEKRLLLQQVSTKAAMKANEAPSPDAVAPFRVAAELLDRIVVQRSRALCKQIEREQGSDVALLFRPDAALPEKLVYEDAYDGTHDVLAGFLPLFATGDEADAGRAAKHPPLSLKVYMWADVRDGVAEADETSSVVGLQRILVLKRLESSPVSFLITLLRLLALHAHRLRQLSDLCADLAERVRREELDAEVLAALSTMATEDIDRIDLLVSGKVSDERARELLKHWSASHRSSKKSSADEDVPPAQLEMFARAQDDALTADKREQLDRLWGLKADLVQDFALLLSVAPGLATLIFGSFERDDWPKKFIAGGEDVDWPTSATWGLRVITDAKIRKLVGRLLRGRADKQKIIVFSQFTDTLAYVGSVLDATEGFEPLQRQAALDLLSADAGREVTEEDLRDLIARKRTITGDTADRDVWIDNFAPFYRIGPRGPKVASAPPEEQALLINAWRQSWARALREPVDILLASDVLAEGVNLQDAAMLINYDVHWNPVRMIQRAGRIDRRLSPAVEDAVGFPDLEALAAELDIPAPKYWWHGRKEVAPITVNLLLSPELEEALKLRERIANKTLAIDFTLGLEQGTGAEADWMANYRYQGISALNAWQRDRAIEQVAGYQERLRRVLAERTIQPGWVDGWNGWLREEGAGEEGPIVAWAKLGLVGGTATPYSRLLTPAVFDGVPHWLWTMAKPKDSILNFWLRLDGQQKVASTTPCAGWSQDASRPLSADDLLMTARRLVDGTPTIADRGSQVGKLLAQGAAAISAGSLGDASDRAAIKVAGMRVLQLRTLRVVSAPAQAMPAPRRGIARACTTCGAPASMHKCCPSCTLTANGEDEVEAQFGFRLQRSVDGGAYDVPQTWCRACRQRSPHNPEPDENEC